MNFNKMLRILHVTMHPVILGGNNLTVKRGNYLEL